ncbi:Palmitoylated plasma membrane-bound casein kinase [Collariella sp. IMI 366227]|nr:Palmitoylated plasma membrane-bound casein kinase [Collariella sp. IMI 366227]
MELLGPSLESLFAKQKRMFTLKTVVMLAKRMLNAVELIHAKGIIHRDLKPENFLLGRPETSAADQIHPIDFGMAKHYRNPKTQKHIPDREMRPLLGTARYMSINTHLGREQSRRDDLEALCYVWLYFLRGSLPWQGMKASTNTKSYTQIGEKKQQTTIDDLCAGFPEEFAECVRYVRGLNFEDQPDYRHLQDLLSQVLRNAGEVDDGEFDWMTVGEERLRELEIRPPPGPVGGNAELPALQTPMSMTGKRPRTDSGKPEPEDHVQPSVVLPVVIVQE